MCSFEISHYKKKRGAERIRFVDIAAPDFNAKTEGLDPLMVHKEFHVKDQSGRIYAGVDAFVQIWRELEILGPLDRLVNAKALRPLVNLGYRGFAVVRPWFRRKAPNCEAGTCQIKL
jgi:predicted DCC family thiol-disulfide oxidoreductase YuxK